MIINRGTTAAMPDPGKRYDLDTLTGYIGELDGYRRALGELRQRCISARDSLDADGLKVEAGRLGCATDEYLIQAHDCITEAYAALSRKALIEKGARAFEAEAGGHGSEEA